MSLAVVFGLCGTAVAKPDWDRIERSLPIRADIRVRMEIDGRANLHERAAMPTAERPAANKEKPDNLREGPTLAGLPIKSQIMLKMTNGGEGRATDDGRKSSGRNPGSSVAEQKNVTPKMGIAVNGDRRPLSKAEQDIVCKHTGVCLSDVASDDPADKAR
jgi:hypothetical protein